MNAPRSGQLYARAAPRLQAYLRDFLVYMAILGFFIVVAVVSRSDLATKVSVVLCLVTFLLYEPVAVTVAGGTIGHVTMNLRIVRAADLGRVSFARALVRTVVKGVLGIWVFLAVYLTSKGQAVHDLVAGTVVVPRDPVTIPQSGFMVEKAGVGR